jgi:Predicted outer membrane protein
MQRTTALRGRLHEGAPRGKTFAVALTVAMATLGAAGTSASASPQTPVTSATRSSGTGNTARPTAAGRHFMETASRSNAAEISAGRIALQKSRNEDVRRIAQTLIDDHTKAQAQLQQIAKRNGMSSLPSEPDPLHRELASRLQAASDEEFDRMFIAAQVRDHLTAVSLFESAANLARDPDVSGYALASLPALRQHTQSILDMAQGMNIRVAAMSLPMSLGGAMGGFGTSTSGVDRPGAPTPGAAPGDPGRAEGTTVDVRGANSATPAVATGSAEEVVPVETVGSAPAGFLNRTVVGSGRVGETVGNRVFFLTPTTGAASAGGVASSGGLPAEPGRRLMAVLGNSFTENNSPVLRTGQIIQFRAVVRDPRQESLMPTAKLPQNARDLLRDEQAVLVIEAITEGTSGGLQQVGP